MSIENSISELDVSATKAVEIMNLLDLTPDDLNDPSRFRKFHETVKYLSTQPDYRFFINKVTVGKMADKLNHVFEYSILNQRKEAKSAEYSNQQKQLSTLMRMTDGTNQLPEGYNELVTSIDNTQKELSRIDEEIRIYEK